MENLAAGNLCTLLQNKQQLTDTTTWGMVWWYYEIKLDLVMAYQSINICLIPSLSGWLDHDVSNPETVHLPWVWLKSDTMSPKSSCFSPASHTTSVRWCTSPQGASSHSPSDKNSPSSCTTPWWYAHASVLHPIWVGHSSVALHMPNAGAVCASQGNHLRKTNPFI